MNNNKSIFIKIGPLLISNCSYPLVTSLECPIPIKGLNLPEFGNQALPP